MRLLIIALLFPVFSFAQDSLCHKCDSGYSCMIGIGTSSLTLMDVHCVPDSVVKKRWRMLEENMCGEMGFGSMSLAEPTKYYVPLSYSENNTWNDSCGCITTIRYSKRVKEGWVDISKDEYDIIRKWNDAQEKKRSKPKLFNPESRNKGFWYKQSIVVASAMLAGFTRHERDVLRDYYVKGYLKVWPNTNQQWTNPHLSRNNKYVDGDESKGRKKLIGNINMPVAFSDKYHFSTFQIRLCYSITLGTSLTLWKKPNWKQIAGQVATVFVADVVGNGISSVLYGY